MMFSPLRMSLWLAGLSGLVLALLLGSCRPCAQLTATWEQELVDELARVGPGLAPDSGVTDHLRLVVATDTLDFIAEALAAVPWPGKVLRSQIVPVGEGPAVTISGELTSRIDHVRIDPENTGEPALLFEMQGSVSLAFTALNRSTRRQTTVIQARFRAPLAFRESDGVARLMMLPRQSTLLSLDGEMLGLPAGYEDLDGGEVWSLVETLVQAATSSPNRELVLLGWGPLQTPVGPMRLTPSSLRVFGGGKQLVLGVVTDARPRGRLERFLPADCDEANRSVCDPFGDSESAGFAYDVHPDLFRSLLALAHANGRLPRRFDPAGEARIDGAYGYELLELSLVEEQLQMELLGVRLEGACGVERTRYVAGLTPEAPTLGLWWQTVAGEGAFSGAPGWSSIAAQVGELVGAVLNPPPLLLPGGRSFVPAPTAGLATPQRIRLVGELRSE